MSQPVALLIGLAALACNAHAQFLPGPPGDAFFLLPPTSSMGTVTNNLTIPNFVTHFTVTGQVIVSEPPGVVARPLAPGGPPHPASAAAPVAPHWCHETAESAALHFLVRLSSARSERTLRFASTACRRSTPSCAPRWCRNKCRQSRAGSLGRSTGRMRGKL